ncbi:hypothetical protein XF_0349 [Xylella fastidiosa 9a5c]|uniref:Uncharacterized protein n=1 Tax=Xylella fastidiosa (strain 9a5c) TaxID=160492 RepID=Q9PGF3_XYLFA|nr:hypothetical protein XF_0349 [Xylella fastidiosa 9a5c]
MLALLTCTCVAGMKMQYLNYKSPLIATNALPHQLSAHTVIIYRCLMRFLGNSNMGFW